MYICQECGAVFEEPKIFLEQHPYGLGYAEERWVVCPRCSNADFDDAEMCDGCGEYFAELEEGLCEECYAELEDEICDEMCKEGVLI